MTAEYLVARCPHCGLEEALEHDRWRVFVEDGINVGSVTGEAYEDDPGGALHQFADIPSEWAPFQGGRLVPLLGSCETLERPYGDSRPLRSFETDTSRQALPPSAEDHCGLKRAYGRRGGYKDIYSCQHCDGAFYVVYNNEGQGDIVSRPDGWEGREPLSPVKDIAEIEATVESDDNSIEIRFSPAVDGRTHSIKFDLARGITESDGFQLMKNEALTNSCLDRLPLGFSRTGLFSRVASLMEERTCSQRHALGLIGASRRSTVQGPSFGPGCNLVDLAIANRLRGYPDALYENIFVQEHGRPYAHTPAIAPFEALPVRYEGISDAYDASGLPQLKSIRRLAFEQPLVISYARSLGRVPFSDPNILRELLSSDAALQVLEQLTLSTGEITVLEYLNETRGELATWRYLKGLMDGNAPISFISCGGRRGELSDGVRRLIDGLPMDKARKTLCMVLADRAGCAHGLMDGYSYTAEERELEGGIGGFAFKLPATPLDVVAADDDMGNCLASYIDRIGENLAILIISSSSRAEGAIEINMPERRVVQAKGRYNKRLPGGSALHGAFVIWLREKLLPLRNAPGQAACCHGANTTHGR